MPSHKIKTGDLIEITATRKNPAYITRLDGSTPVGSFYVPTSIVGIYLGSEPVNLSVDWVDCVVFLHEGARHALINGDFKKMR
jgi:hypothetical protein